MSTTAYPLPDDRGVLEWGKDAPVGDGVPREDPLRSHPGPVRVRLRLTPVEIDPDVSGPTSCVPEPPTSSPVPLTPFPVSFLSLRPSVPLPSRSPVLLASTPHPDRATSRETVICPYEIVCRRSLSIRDRKKLFTDTSDGNKQGIQERKGRERAHLYLL